MCNIMYENDEKDTPGNEHLKRKNVCNGLSVCYFMKRLCCYELLRNLYNIPRICREYWMYNKENTELFVKNVNVQKNMLTNHKGSDIVRMYKIIHMKS